MSTRNYQIVACSVPVVYTPDGDVDVNGMVFVPKAFEPLLEWCKDLWYYSAASVPSTSDRQRKSRGKSEQLPTLHHRRQRVELVIHGLERLDLMVQRLAAGRDEDRALLAQLIALEQTASNEQCDHYLSDPHHDHRDHWRYHASDRARAVRMNIERQITELQIALTDLRNTRGLPRWRSCEDGTPTPAGRTDAASLAKAGTAAAATDADAEPPKAIGLQSFLADAEVADPFNVIPIRLVSLSSRQRLEWRDFWKVQLGLLDHAIQQWFETVESHPAYGKTLQALAKAAGLPGASQPSGGPWIQRLLLNDHKDPNRRSGPCDRFNPMKPIPLLRPLVLRACKGETVTITLENSLERRPVGFFIQGHHGKAMATAAKGPFHPGVAWADGSHLGDNADSRCAPGQKVFIQLTVEDEGVWPINDLADVRGNPDGTNTHGLFGALIVEPPKSHWLHAETGEDLTAAPWATMLDVIIEPQEVKKKEQPTEAKPYIDLETDKLNGVRRTFREFTVFIHDEPETHSGLHTVGEHSIMPLSYRSEPMHNRAMQLRRLAQQTAEHPRKLAAGDIDRRAVGWDLTDELDEVTLTARTTTADGTERWLEYIAGEEQHHSSWLFGDPVTHIQRAYAGDPCRVRLVHAGVKETHIYHLHVHEWHAVRTHTGGPSSHGEAAYDDDGKAKSCDEIVVDPVYGKVKAGRGSHLLDSITISPQTGMTIDPLFGSGSRQHAIGDIVWHCHLYPHFHHGMWGLWRSHDRLVDGSRPYPDGSYCPPLAALPDKPPPASTLETPGFPWFIDGIFPAKSPPPPAAKPEQRNGRRITLKMGAASVLERAAMAEGCRTGDSPGALFVDLDGLARKWNAEAGLKTQRKLSYDIEVRSDRIDYNVDGWHDPRGHRYRLMAVTVSEKPVEGDHEWVVTHTEQFPYDPKANPEPCFPRANHGDIVEWRQHNNFTRYNADQYDFGQLPVECGLHVHLVKFDVLAADGSATGWNYISGASCREMVGEDGPGELRTVSLHRWVVDEEFGPCFFHDHLLANHRQKRGLFSALMVQPQGSQWQRHDDQSRTAWHEPQAVIIPPESAKLPPYREACLGVADYVPLVDKHSHAINPPPTLGGMSDPGVMGVNYRCAPMRFRGADPSLWFSSAGRRTPNFAGEPGDPDTPIIQSYPGERLRIRLIQGSHEEQHSFTAHGLRWRRDWGHPGATLVNQQTLGISEAFTLEINPADASAYGVGDHLWHFGTLDDIWLGNWGLVRVLPPIQSNFERFAPLPDLKNPPAKAREALCKAAEALTPPIRGVPAHPKGPVRSFVVAAQRQEHRYVGDVLTDPWGLIYRALPYADEQAIETALKEAKATEALTALSGDKDWLHKRNAGWVIPPQMRNALTDTPLVLRARAGEWIRFILINDVLEPDEDDLHRQREGRQRFGPELSPARVPAEHRDVLGRPDRRTVSTRVSIHPSLLTYDVRSNDGSFVGRNPDTTVSARQQRGDAHGLHQGDQADGPVNDVISRPDHSGFRNWREYWWYADPALAPTLAAEGGMGQVCYLHDMADIRNHRHHGLIGAVIVLPSDVAPFAPGSDSAEPDGWASFNADIRDANSRELVARESCWFLQDGLRFFVHGSHHAPMTDVEPGVDPVDCGQKAVNYRSWPVRHGAVTRTSAELCPDPLLQTHAGEPVWLRVVGANDKPRQQGIVVHGAALRQAGWMGAESPLLGAMGGISPCRAESFAFTLTHEGDHAVRSCCFLWATQQGVWGQIRVKK